jgi:hypothetical protein
MARHRRWKVPVALGARSAVPVLVGAVALLAGFLTQARAAPEQGPEILARVGEDVITAEDYRLAVHAGMRQRFFHGRIPEDQRRAFRAEVARTMVERLLLLQEAERRDIRPDGDWVDEQVAAVEARYAGRPAWDEARETWLPGLRKELEAQSIVARLRAQVESIPAPDRVTVRAYYEAHGDKFTTPERQRVSIILLKVEPWSAAPAWQAAEDEALRLVKKLRDGADFAALARLHSADQSAERGGDLGYIHRGMFSEEAQQVVDGLPLGGVSAPVRILQGFAIFRLEERVPSVLNTFEKSAERAEALWIRERKAQVWQELLDSLRAKTRIEMNEAIVSAAD